MRDTDVRNPLERLAIPHQFSPRLSILGAALAVTAALTQILFGCLIAAVWGAEIWLAAASRHSPVLKSLAICGLFAGMAISLWLLFVGVNALVAKLQKKI